MFYLAKMYAEQISPGQDYDVLKKCVGISILDFELFCNQTGFYSCFHIREDTHGFIYTDKLEFHVIELPKLPEGLREDCGDIELWAKFINAERKEEFDMLAQKNQYIESAYEHLQIISQDKEKRLAYEAREKAIRDHNQLIKEAHKHGEKIGRELEAERINRLNSILLKEKHYADLERSTNDKDFQEQLMLQHGI